MGVKWLEEEFGHLKLDKLLFPYHRILAYLFNNPLIRSTFGRFERGACSDTSSLHGHGLATWLGRRSPGGHRILRGGGVLARHHVTVSPGLVWLPL